MKLENGWDLENVLIRGKLWSVMLEEEYERYGFATGVRILKIKFFEINMVT